MAGSSGPVRVLGRELPRRRLVVALVLALALTPYAAHLWSTVPAFTGDDHPNEFILVVLATGVAIFAIVAAALSSRSPRTPKQPTRATG
jgi:hypothetical protein